MGNTIKNIYEELNNTINSFLFMDKYRLSKTAFTRTRILTFPTLILFLLNFRKHSNQVELDQFFKNINKEKDASQVITKHAFFQSRKQLSHTAFIDLNQQIITSTYKSVKDLKKWKGFRLCAVDGTSIRLPNTPDIKSYFGIQKGKKGQDDCTLGMASVFYDVLNQLTIDSSINPNGHSERSCVFDHLKHSTPNDLVIYDRGYVAFWLYSLHIHHKNYFCIRAKTQQLLALKYQVNSAQALSKMKHQLVILILDAHKGILQLIRRIIDYISVTMEAARKWRSAPRTLKNIKNDIHFTAYKSSL